YVAVVQRAFAPSSERAHAHALATNELVVEYLEHLSTLKVVAFRIARATGPVAFGTCGLVPAVTPGLGRHEVIAQRRPDRRRPVILVAACQRGDGSGDDAEQQALKGKGAAFVSHSGAVQASKSESRGTPANVTAIPTRVGVGTG